MKNCESLHYIFIENVSHKMYKYFSVLIALYNRLLYNGYGKFKEALWQN